MLIFAESAPLGCRHTCSHHTRRRPLFFIPRAAILRGGALSGTFHPNARRHEDMTITADFSCRGPSARRPARPPSAACLFVGLRVAGRRTPVSRDALSLGPFRLPEPEPYVAQRPSIPQGDFLRGGGLPAGRTAWRAAIPSPGFSAGLGASVCSSVCRRARSSVFQMNV